MNFRKYQSIENSDKVEFLEQIDKEGLGNKTFIVQEKVHGANLSIWTVDGENFVTAKRTDFLCPEERFFNHQEVLVELKPKLKKLYSLLKSKYAATNVVVYGELIGGHYPHKDVLKDKAAIMVQKGVAYSPSNMFYAFDIYIENRGFVPIKEANQYFQDFGFLYAHSLFEGSLKDCLSYPNEFQSTIAKELGLPLNENNICEGVIIRDPENRYLSNGGRILIKNKNAKWAEKEKVFRPKKVVPSNVQNMQEEIAKYVNKNRFMNVISKFGEASMSNFGELMGHFSRDIIADFEKDNQLALEQLSPEDIKSLTKSINSKAVKIVKEILA